MLTRCLSACTVLACTLPSVGHAHHGLDFILVQTAHLPERGTGYVFTRLNHFSGTEDETEIEPGVLYGVNDWMALEAHAHYAKEGGESLTYESIAPAVHFRLTPMGEPVSFGVSAEYAFAQDSDEDDVADVTGVFSVERNGWMVAANLLYEKRSGSSGEFGYAAGARRTLRGKHGIGVEVVGSFESDGDSEVMLGYYGELSQKFTLNAGIGSSIDEGPDHAAHVTFVWRFR